MRLQSPIITTFKLTHIARKWFLAQMHPEMSFNITGVVRVELARETHILVAIGVGPWHVHARFTMLQ